MSKGITGNWKNHVTVTQNDHFDTVLRERGLDEELLSNLLMQIHKKLFAVKLYNMDM